MYKVIDNFLEESEMNIIEETIMSNTFPWFYLNSVTDHIDENDEPMYFHLLVRDGVNNSEKFTDLLIDKLVKKVNMQGVFRAKINSYTRTKELWKSNWHFDNKDYKIALFYINDNDGYTELKNITKIYSKRNRLLLFNGDIEHRATNCTDAKRRINININYA